MQSAELRKSHTNLAWDVLLELDGGAGGSLSRRLRRALVAAIRSGRLPTASALPPSRKLAADLGCSRWVVTEAYAQLIAEGYLEGRAGSATRVRWSATPSGPPPDARPGARRPPLFDLSPGLPDLRAFPRQRWAAAIRIEAQRVGYSDLGYPSRGGHPRLRRALAEYLVRVRGAVVEADDVTVCTGITDGVTHACRALRAAGVTSIAIEDPGWPPIGRAAATAGLDLVRVAVDRDGLRVADLEAQPGVGAVVATPAHQFPTGVMLAPARRAALLEWARRVDGVVLEDDYDAEFRYGRRPIGTMQGMDPSRVILLGTLSKTLSPALGIGWVVAPPRWTEALRAVRGRFGAPSTLDQLALTTFIEAGWLDRHLRAARQRYHARREAVVRALAEALPDCRVAGTAAGLYLLLLLPAGVDPAAVVREAAERGVYLVNLDSVRAGEGPPGLVVGYGNLADHAVPDAVRALAAGIRAAGRVE